MWKNFSINKNIFIPLVLIIIALTHIKNIAAQTEEVHSKNLISRSATVAEEDQFSYINSIVITYTLTNFDPLQHTIMVTAKESISTDEIDPENIILSEDNLTVTVTGLEPGLEIIVKYLIDFGDPDIDPPSTDVETTISFAEYPSYINSVVNDNQSLSYTAKYDGKDEPESCQIVLVTDNKPVETGEILECIKKSTRLTYGDDSSLTYEDAINDESFSKFHRHYSKAENYRRKITDPSYCLCSEGTVFLYRPLGPREKIYLTDSLYSLISEPLLVGFDVAKLSTGEIIAVSVGTVIILLLILGAIYLMRKRRT